MSKKEKENINQSYTEKDIYVLEGLEPVRKRPAMYIGSTGKEGLHHLIFEVLDNSIDEVLAGFCNTIFVILYPENFISIIDNGRGIPVGIHPQTKKSTLETVLTYLHAGGKFTSKVYKASGGLHGVGISVVCALSSFLRAVSIRDGQVFFQNYSKGRPTTSVKSLGLRKETKYREILFGENVSEFFENLDFFDVLENVLPKFKTGTIITFRPDKEIFKSIEFDPKIILERVKEEAYLTKNLNITFIDCSQRKIKIYSYFFENGILMFLKEITESKKQVHNNPILITKIKDKFQLECAINYLEDSSSKELSFVNNIITKEGGTHITGFRSALTKVFNEYARKNNILKKNDPNFTGDDIREGLYAVISLRIPNPEFEGQTKTKLGNPEVRKIVEKEVSEALSEYLQVYKDDAKLIINKIILNQKSRILAQKAKESVLRKGYLEGLSLPGKLADCQTQDPDEAELFIVEGDSAGGSAKQGRNRYNQAILPIKGKILNVEKATLNKALTSEEIKSIILALGTSIFENFDINKIRYKKNIIMCDADSDGHHIKTLLLTLFFKYFRPIIEKGYLYIANPPLYRIKKGGKVFYAYSDKEKDEIIKNLSKDSRSSSIEISRFKGLGEMNPEELYQTTMNPEKRILRKVTIEEAQEAERLFNILMGKEVKLRRKFIEAHARDVKDLDI